MSFHKGERRWLVHCDLEKSPESMCTRISVGSLSWSCSPGPWPMTGLLSCFRAGQRRPIGLLRSIIWKVTSNYQKATRIASAAGQGAGYVFILLGIIQFFTGHFFNGLWTAFIGWFLLSAAQSAVAQVEVESNLQGVCVKHVM